MYYIVIALLCGIISGCSRYTKPATPEEQAAQEQMMRNVLNDSSPRNMNQHPKVTDEFKRTFSTRGFFGNPKTEGDNKQGRSIGQPQHQGNSAQDVPMTKQSEDEEESWW